MRNIHCAAFIAGLVALLGVLLPVAECGNRIVSSFELAGVTPLLYLFPFAVLAVPAMSWLSRGTPAEALYVTLGTSGFLTVLAALRSGCIYLQGLEEGAALGQMVPGVGTVLMWLAYLALGMLPFVPYFQARKKEDLGCDLAPDRGAVHPSQL